MTLESARAIYEASDNERALWAQVVKNGYDAIEQAVSAGIASEGRSIPRSHPAKISTFIDFHDPDEHVQDRLLYWLRRRNDSQYVDLRNDELNVPHRQFDEGDAKEVLSDAEMVIELVERVIDNTS